MSLTVDNLDRIQKDSKRMQELARDLKAAHSAREARRISREMSRLSKEIEEASQAAGGYDTDARAAG